MRHDFVSRVENAVAIFVTHEGLLGVLDEIANPEGVPGGIPHGHPRRGDPVVGKIVPRKCIPMSNSKRWHLNANQEVLDGCGEIVRSVPLYLVWDGAQPNQDGQQETLPIRGEDDELDAQEFGHRAEWYQIVVHADPKQPQRVETDGDADVVDDAAPEIARFQADVALLVCASSLHDDGSQGEDRLEPRILQDAAFYSKERVRIGYVDAGEDMVDRPEMVNRFAAVRHDNEGSFTADIVDQQLEEGVDGKGLRI
jgi:hypothetical protein